MALVGAFRVVSMAEKRLPLLLVVPGRRDRFLTWRIAYVDNVTELANHCGDLHDKVRAILQKEPIQIRVNVLLASLFGATDGAPHQMWAPLLANFLVLLAHRDGVYVGVSAVDSDDDDVGEEGEEATLH
jgi:hypothetical protein